MEATCSHCPQSHERTHKNPWCRWPCSFVLGRICGPSAVPAPGPVASGSASERLKAGGPGIGVPVFTWKPIAPPIQLTPDVSGKGSACHRNNDHAEAVLSYARHYGALKAPSRPGCLQVLPEAMETGGGTASTVAVP